MIRFAAALAACTMLTPAFGFDLQGHRGARGLAPENTLAAFQKALDIGVTTLELDVFLTKDGVMVVHHDPALNPDITRGPDGQWLAEKGPRIRDLTFEQLSRYDVGRLKPGTRYGSQYPEQVPADGERIPKLSDVFALVERGGHRDVRFNIEAKLHPMNPDDTPEPEAYARAVLAEVRKAGVASRSTIQSFDWRIMQVVQKDAPDITTGYLSIRRGFDNICGGKGGTRPLIAPADCEPSSWTAGFQLREHGSVAKMVKAAGGRVWSPFFGDVDADAVAEARALGLRVVPWTVNDPAQIEKVLDLKVDGIITDRPDLVRKAMQPLGIPLPKGKGAAS